MEEAALANRARGSPKGARISVIFSGVGGRLSKSAQGEGTWPQPRRARPRIAVGPDAFERTPGLTRGPVHTCGVATRVSALLSAHVVSRTTCPPHEMRGGNVACVGVGSSSRVQDGSDAWIGRGEAGEQRPQLGLQEARCGCKACRREGEERFPAAWKLGHDGLWADIAEFRPKLARDRPKFARIRADFAQSRPRLSRNQPELSRSRSNLARFRPTMARIRPKLAGIGPEINQAWSEFDQSWLHIGQVLPRPKFDQSLPWIGQTWLDFDQHACRARPDVARHRPSLTTCWSGFASASPEFDARLRPNCGPMFES